MSIQYNKNNINPGDDIKSLPVDKTPPNNKEVQIVDTIFKQNRSTLDIIFEDSKDVLIIIILITILSMPQLTEIIQKTIPITKNSEYFLYFSKYSLALCKLAK